MDVCTTIPLACVPQPFCQFFETALANLPSHILQVLLCYSVAIAASCKELVNPTIRTTRSTIFDDRREDGKCQLKVETICSFFNLSWYVKSWRSPPLKSSRICLKRSRSSTPSNTMHIALKKIQNWSSDIIVRSKRFRSNSSQMLTFYF